LRPSIHVSSTRDAGEKGLAVRIEKSASLPASREPTRSSMRSWRAGFRVTKRIASSGGTFPYFVALAASRLRMRASSSESVWKR
jgi:hypothetical protein